MINKDIIIIYELPFAVRFNDTWPESTNVGTTADDQEKCGQKRLEVK